MKLMVIVLCLLSERFLIHAISYTRFDWFQRYMLSVQQCATKYHLPQHSLSFLLLYCLPILFIVGFIYLIFDSILFGLCSFLMNLAVFYYCLGPKNPFYPDLEEGDAFSARERIGHYLVLVTNQLFAVIFWYIIGGPLFVLAFRLISLAQHDASTKTLAKDIIEILEWIPVRLTALLYLLVGNFQPGFKRFIHFMVAAPSHNHQMLAECGLSALRVNEREEIPVPAAQQLVEHAVTVLLVFLALFTLLA